MQEFLAAAIERARAREVWTAPSLCWWSFNKIIMTCQIKPFMPLDEIHKPLLKIKMLLLKIKMLLLKIKMLFASFSSGGDEGGINVC